MKTFFKLIAGMSCMCLLTGCMLTDYNDGPGMINETVVTDPIKNTDSNVDLNGNENIDDTNNEPETIVAKYDTYMVNIEAKVNSEEAKESALVKGLDEDFNVIWEYETPEQYVGQFNGICDMYEQDNGYYLFANSSVYCFDLSMGEPKWVCEMPHQLTGVSFAFDKDGTVYLMGPETTEIFGVNTDGEISYHMDSLKFVEDEAFWASFMIVSDGYIQISFDSDDSERTFNLKTGKEEAYTPDLSCFEGQWEQVAHEIEGDRTEGDLMSSIMCFEMDDMGYTSISITQTNSDVPADFYFDMYPEVKLGSLFYGIEPSVYGEWYLDMRGGEDVYFSAQLDADDKLTVLYFHEWEDSYYPTVSMYEFVRK